MKLLEESITIQLEGDIEHQTPSDEAEIDKAISELEEKGYDIIYPQVSKRTGYKILTLKGIKREIAGDR